MSQDIKGAARRRRKAHIRKKVFGTPERLRLSVFRSASHIYAQVINDVEGRTIVSASSLELRAESGATGNKATARIVGRKLAERALEAGIGAVCFDRNGFLYHGRVKELADAAREAGLSF
jgi:large subunit ribosomal protein L18